MEELYDLEGVRVSGGNINSIRYTHDTVLLADSQEKLQELVETLQGTCSGGVLHIYLGQGITEVMAITERS